MFSLSTTCSVLVLMILKELEYLCIFSLLLSTSGWDEPKGSEVIKRRQEESVGALRLVPIETCLKSIFIRRQEGRAGSLFPELGHRQGNMQVLSDLHLHVLNSVCCQQGKTRHREYSLWLPSSGCWSWVRWGPYFEKGLHACTQGRKVCFQHSLPHREPGSGQRDQEATVISMLPTGFRERERLFLRTQRDCLGLAAN